MNFLYRCVNVYILHGFEAIKAFLGLLRTTIFCSNPKYIRRLLYTEVNIARIRGNFAFAAG